MDQPGSTDRGGGARALRTLLLTVALAGATAAVWFVLREVPLRPTDRGEPVGSVPPAAAASGAMDDIEFGQKLASRAMFDLARKVYEKMLADPESPPSEKARARYGMALVGREEAHAFALRPDSPWAEIKAKYESAATVIQDFVAQNASDAKADQAKIELGMLYLQIGQWISDQLKPDESDPSVRDAKVNDFLKRRKTSRNDLYADARGYVDKAIDLFDMAQNSAKSRGDKDLGAYYFATSQYYRGLVHPPCSAPALSAFEESLKTLEDYAAVNDERLTGTYAEDFLGLSEWEVAKCKTDPKERSTRYGKARAWFEACTAVENASLEHLKLIMRGFYHLAQMSLEAGRQEGRDFWKSGSLELKKMEKNPEAAHVPIGCKAYVEWARVEAAQGNFEEAIRLATFASEQAKASGFPDEERLAVKALSDIVEQSRR